MCACILFKTLSIIMKEIYKSNLEIYKNITIYICQPNNSYNMNYNSVLTFITLNYESQISHIFAWAYVCIIHL